VNTTHTRTTDSFENFNYRYPGFPPLLENPGKSWNFYWKISRTWKVLENDLGPGKSWKSTCKVLESPGIC